MRRGVLVAGLVLLLIGILLFVAVALANPGSTTAGITAGQAEVLKATAITSEKLSVHWSSAGSNGVVYVTTATPSCPTPSGVVSQGSGNSGTLSATLAPGKQYSLFACGASGFHSVTVTYSITGGTTWGDVFGGLLVFLGLVLLLLSLRRRADDEDDRGHSGRRRSDPLAGLGLEEFSRPRRTTPGARSVGASRPDQVPVTSPSSRGPPVRPATVTTRRGARPVQQCPGCGRVYTRGRYSTCPACSSPL